MLQQTPVQSQVVPKEIQMEFYHYTKPQLQAVFKLLRYDEVICYDFLDQAKQTIVERVADECLKWENQGQPDWAEKMFELILVKKFTIVRKFLKNKMSLEDFLGEPTSNTENEKQEDEIVQDGILFRYPHHILMKFLDFLDPFSLVMFQSTCRDFRSMNSDMLYKKFIKSLYNIKPTRVPPISPFEEIKNFVNAQPEIYSADLINQINDDFRGLVWSDVKYHLFLESEYNLKALSKPYKTFKQIFMKAPRLNYCGVYAVQEKYMKIGEASLNHSYAPCIIVEYYRYVRFWPEGTVTMRISTKKLNRQAILKSFSSYTYQQNPNKPFESEEDRLNQQIIRGEYVVETDKVIMKTFNHTTIFTFGLQIQSSKHGGPSDLLLVHFAQMRMLGDEYRYDLKKDHQLKCFQYKHIKEFRQDLQSLGPQWEITTY